MENNGNNVIKSETNLATNLVRRNPDNLSSR